MCVCVCVCVYAFVCIPCVCVSGLFCFSLLYVCVLFWLLCFAVVFRFSENSIFTQIRLKKILPKGVLKTSFPFFFISYLCLAVCLSSHEQNWYGWQKCQLCYEPIFFCSSLIKSEPAWLHHEAPNSKLKKYRYNYTDRTRAACKWKHSHTFS